MVAQICLSVHSQKLLSLDELFNLADEQSQSIKVKKTVVEGAEKTVQSAVSQRRPDFDAELNLGYLGNGLLGDRSFNKWTKVENPHFTNNLTLKAKQVVYAGGAISSGIELARIGRQFAQLDLENNRQEVRMFLTELYFNLCRLKNQTKVLEENIRLTDTLIANVNSMVKQGMSLKNDITRFELQKEKLKLQRQKMLDAQSIINYQIVSTLHLDSVVKIEPDTSFLSTTPSLQNEDYWQQEALTSNLLLQLAENAIKRNGQNIKMSRSSKLPKVAFVAEDHLDGPITTEVPVIDKNFNYWFVGIGIQYSISSFYKKNDDLEKARVELRAAEEQRILAQEQINTAVQAAYTNFLTVKSDLRIQQKSVQLANENFFVANNRYINGLCLLSDIIDASNSKLDAELALENARINVLYNYYQLKYLTSNL